MQVDVKILRSRFVVKSAVFLLIVVSFITALPAAGQYGLKEILSSTKIERLQQPIAVPLQIVPVESQAVLDDRWFASEAFRGPYHDEFLEGLDYYLKARGFVIAASPDAAIVKVTLDGFEGRKRIHDDGGDLRGTLTVTRNAQVLATKPLFESLSYRDEAMERPVFEKEYGLKKVSFSTVLFTRLSQSFYRSIEAGIVACLAGEAHPSPNMETAQEESSTSPRTEEEVGTVTIESEPSVAEIYLDDELIGTTPAKQLRLAAGSYTIILKKKGFHDWIREVNILSGNDVELKAELNKR